MSQKLDKLFKQIQKNSEELAEQAMMAAANKAFELAKEEAENCLKNYLKKKPKIYKRRGDIPLKKALVEGAPKLKTKGSSSTIIFGLRYDAEKFKGMYKSNSWYHQSGDKWVSRYDDPEHFNFNGQNNGIPDSEWILNNYLDGKHPGWVNGKDYGWTDSTNPRETMKNFFEKELLAKAPDLIYEAMTNAVINFLNTNGGGK